MPGKVVCALTIFSERDGLANAIYFGQFLGDITHGLCGICAIMRVSPVVEDYCATICAAWKTSAGHDGDARKTGDVFRKDQNAGLRSLMRVLIPEKNQMGAGKTCRTDLPRPVVRREPEALHLTESRHEMIARAASCQGASESERLGLH